MLTLSRKNRYCRSIILARLPSPKDVGYIHAVIVASDVVENANVDDVPQLTTSSVPSNTILPPFPLLNVGPFVSVPSLPRPLKSVHVLPLPGYDEPVPASKYKTKLPV